MGAPTFPPRSQPLQGTPKWGGGESWELGEQKPPALPQQGQGTGREPLGVQGDPPGMVPPNHCRGEIFRGIIIRDSMVRISGTGEGKERQVRAGGSQHGQGVTKVSGGPLTSIINILIPAPLPPGRIPRLLPGLQIPVGCGELTQLAP